MDKKKELKITVTGTLVREELLFECQVEHDLDLRKGVQWEGFRFIIPSAGLLRIGWDFSISPDRRGDPNFRPFDLTDILGTTLEPIETAIGGYTLTETEFKEMRNCFSSKMTPKANEYFGELLKEILEGVGYTVIITVQDYYFPSPTSMGVVSPVFGMGLQKEVKPLETIEGYETTLIYLSHEKPQSKTQIQLRLLDAIPEERLNELQRSFKDNLSPYGLKCLYLVIEECGHNKRNPWFVLDTNRCLDTMGYKRIRKGIHHTKNRKRLLQELNELTRINFNIERREPKRGDKDKVIRVTTPLLSITGKFEEWEVKTGRPIEEGTQIKDNVQIFLHPEIYKYIDNWYTIIPHVFLTIDARSKPHAILLYSYIANQWRIGWHKYQGIIRQPMMQILDGAGLLARLPKRRNQQRDFVGKIIQDLKWLKSQKEFWIESIRVDRRNRPQLDPMVTITVSKDHPLRTAMTKQIREGE